MVDKLQFEYDMNAEFDNLMGGSNQSSRAPTPAQNKKAVN